jgi:photosystem II stability/assembly factor-like uncharacterized protein
LASKNSVYLLLGTRKGAFLLSSNSRRRRWKLKGPFFENCPVFHLAFDYRDGRTIYAAVNSYHFGPTIYRTRNFGAKWERTKTPPRFPEGSAFQIENIWHVEPGHKDDAGLVYAGVAPGALFASLDEGENWELNQALNNHSSRPKWQPGAGGLCLHSIITDPGNKKRIFVGISAVGVFRSEDAGESWYPKNHNVRADFLSSKYPEFGQCVHKLVMDSKNTAHLYQQNHCGVYKSEDGAESWIDITRGLPSRFGFPMITHPRKSGQLYVVPEEGDFFRVAANKEFAVYCTNNAGRTWRKFSKGLPRENAYLGCYREGAASDTLDPAGLYVATRMGHLFSSCDEGKSWRLLVQWLPPIYSVSTAVPSYSD